MKGDGKAQVLTRRLSNTDAAIFLTEKSGFEPEEGFRHEFDSLYLILSGEEVIAVDGEVFSIRAGDLLLIHEGELIKEKIGGESEKIRCDFRFMPEGISIFEIMKFPRFARLDDPKGGFELFSAAQKIAGREDSYGTSRARKILAELLTLVLSGVETKNPFCDRVKLYIGQNIEKKLTAEMTASELGFCEEYFTAVFNKSFKTTFIRYLKQARLAAAKIELLKGETKISDIPEKIGYPDIKKLTKDFAAQTGFSPAEYRQKANQF